MIKKNKDCYKLIAEAINKSLEYNKNVQSPCTPIGLTVLEISRGLYNIGSVAIRDNVCNEMNIEPLDAPFTIDVHDNGDYCNLYVKFK